MKMRLQLLNELDLKDVGHGALDVAGFVPGAGEIADLTNAIWYAEEGLYLSAVFSLISVIPGIGDVAGKGAKYLLKSGKSKFIAKFIAKYGDDIIKHWGKVVKIANKSRKLRPHVSEMEMALKNAISKTREERVAAV